MYVGLHLFVPRNIFRLNLCTECYRGIRQVAYLSTDKCMLFQILRIKSDCKFE